MSSLQSISHHLFVSAIGRSGTAEEEPEPGYEPEGGATAIALEVLEVSEPLTELTARPLLMSSVPGAS